MGRTDGVSGPDVRGPGTWRAGGGHVAEFSGIRGTEENNAGDVHEKLSALRKVAQDHDLAVILIRHANKEGKGRGSSAFEASVDIVIGYKRPDKANSESCTRIIDAVSRWTEANFTTT